jgi:hypothetical protein
MNQVQETMATLLNTQKLLGDLEFTLTSDGRYYKDYGLVNGSSVRIVPTFDKGISLDVRVKLVGFTITTSKTIDVIDGVSTSITDFPIECTDDITKIIGALAPFSRPPLDETFMVTQICSTCNQDSHSYMLIGGEYQCLRCSGFHTEEKE